ncbi:neural cell adhesion molecule 1 [Trichonephila clavipes]|nr:neural cell adhesion molecule 1 [Trichonephila clavipes]
MIWIPNQLVGANLGSNVTLECNTEGYPESINYWSRHESEMISHGGKYDVIFKVTTYKVNMILTIRHVVHNDYGTYRCFARNSLGTTEGTIRLYGGTISFAAFLNRNDGRTPPIPRKLPLVPGTIDDAPRSGQDGQSFDREYHRDQEIYLDKNHTDRSLEFIHSEICTENGGSSMDITAAVMDNTTSPNFDVSVFD